MLNWVIDRNFVDKDILNEIAKMVFEGYTLYEISFYLDIPYKEVERFLGIFNMASSPYYDPNFYIRIKDRLAKTMKLDNTILFKRLEDLEKQGAIIENYPKTTLIKRYYRLKKIYAMIEDFLNDNYDNLEELIIRHHLSTDTLINVVREEDNLNFLNNYVDAVTKYEIKQKYIKHLEERKRILITFSNHNEEKEKLFEVRKNGVFLVLLSIHFKVPVYELVEILEIKDVKSVYNILHDVSFRLGFKYVNAFEYIQFCSKIHTDNLSKAKRFYQKFLLMKKLDYDKALEMLKVLKDYDYHCLVSSKKTIEKMSDEERLIISNYWVKYALPIRKLPYSIASLNKYIRPLNTNDISNIEEYNKEMLNITRRKLLKKNK